MFSLETAKASHRGGASVRPLASAASALEGALAHHLLKAGRTTEAVINLVSQGSCLLDARRLSEAKRVFAKAYSLTTESALRDWIAAQHDGIPIDHTPASVFSAVTPHIEGNRLLRRPQVLAYSAAFKHFHTSTEHAIIQLPVGCGKTGVMAILPFGIAAGRVLVVAPNLEIRRNVASRLDYTQPTAFLRQTEVLQNGQGPTSAILDSAANLHDCDAADYVVTNIQQLVAMARICGPSPTCRAPEGSQLLSRLPADCSERGRPQ